MIERKIKFILNNDVKTVTIKPGTTLLELLQEEYRFLGTKKACNEGDCGACTITLGRYNKNTGNVIYRAVNSCILPAEKINNCMVVTVEGMGDNPEKLHPIQRILYDNYGTQCGYCTPGIIMSIFSYLANENDYTYEELKKSLEGNLCRCTGYVHIIQGLKKILNYYNEHAKSELLDFLSTGISKLKELTYETKDVENEQHLIKNIDGYYLVKSLDKYLEMVNKLKGKGLFKVVAGATDLYVVGNIAKNYFKNYLDISYIPELNKIECKDSNLIIGACTSLESIRTDMTVLDKLPILSKVVSKMASKQIRNIASIGGNIGNASPVGDCATALVGLNARLVLFGLDGEREVSIDQFYKGYKETVLINNEIIKEIKIPLEDSVFHSFIKSSKRITLDISSVCSFASIHFQEGRIGISRFSFGGVAAYPKLSISIPTKIINQRIEDLDINLIASEIENEFAPISDVRGSREFRQVLIRNHIIKHLNRLQEEYKR